MREAAPVSPHAGRFATTHWSMVVDAGRSSSPTAAEALATLCGIYWFPLYAYVRLQGHSIDDAQDLTQAFFVHLLDKQTLRVADPERGRFRSFLLAGPATAGQASMLDSADANAFMGTWVIAFESPRGGTFDQTVTVRDEGGKVAARIEGGRGGANDITDIAKNGDDLVLTFDREGRGSVIDMVLTLTLDGEMMNATQSFAGGQFSISGSGKKQ